jgi:hypothetical protein
MRPNQRNFSWTSLQLADPNLICPKMPYCTTCTLYVAFAGTPATDAYPGEGFIPQGYVNSNGTVTRCWDNEAYEIMNDLASLRYWCPVASSCQMLGQD